MSNVFTLDAMREDAEKKYKPVLIGLSDDTTVELKPLLRLGKKARDAIKDAIQEIQDLPELEEDEEDDEDMVDELAAEVCAIVAKALRLIAVAPRRLIAELDKVENPRVRAEVYTQVLKVWMGESQLGEAESSLS